MNGLDIDFGSDTYSRLQANLVVGGISAIAIKKAPSATRLIPSQRCCVIFSPRKAQAPIATRMWLVAARLNATISGTDLSALIEDKVRTDYHHRPHSHADCDQLPKLMFFDSQQKFQQLRRGVLLWDACDSFL